MNCILPSAYLAPISYYVQLNRYEKNWIEVCDNYQKQSYRNRCVIAATDGPLPLTVPVVKPEGGKVQMREVKISDHGNWRHLHWNALQSAYRNSPFFEYYADDFAPFYEKKWEFLADFNEELCHLLCRLIDIQPVMNRTSAYHPVLDDVDDYRERIHPRLPSVSNVKPYYQVFRDRLGFLPDLSIVDLLFNMGPESVLYL